VGSSAPHLYKKCGELLPCSDAEAARKAAGLSTQILVSGRLDSGLLLGDGRLRLFCGRLFFCLSILWRGWLCRLCLLGNRRLCLPQKTLEMRARERWNRLCGVRTSKSF
jgi:hypothetical protein